MKFHMLKAMQMEANQGQRPRAQMRCACACVAFSVGLEPTVIPPPSGCVGNDILPIQCRGDWVRPLNVRNKNKMKSFAGSRAVTEVVHQVRLVALKALRVFNPAREQSYSARGK